jgi:hypothetical protein
VPKERLTGTPAIADWDAGVLQLVNAVMRASWAQFTPVRHLFPPKH